MMIKKELKENGVMIGSMTVAGVCALTGNCQIGAIVMIPAVLYQSKSVLKDVVKKRSKVVSIQENKQ